MKKIGKILLFLLAASALVIGAKKLIHHRKSELSELDPPISRPQAVNVATVGKGTLSLSRHFLGTIEPMEEATLAPRTEGYLVDMHKQIGDRVKAGELVARIRDRLVTEQRRASAARLKGAKDELALLEKELQRRRKLFKKGHLSEDKLDKSRRRYRTARARVDQLKAELEASAVSENFTKISAPFSGVISERYRDRGDLVRPGQAVYRVENPDAGYRILADLPHTFQGKLKPGDRVMITHGDRQMQAEINRIHPAAHKGNLSTAEIRTEKPPFSLPSGAVTGLDIYYAQVQGLVVPTASLVNSQKESFLFRVDQQNKIHKFRVKVLGQKDGESVINGGITSGDIIVRGRESMLLQLHDGQAVYPADGSIQ
mgnify:FL=1